ncbi:17118_t:CDS:1 [Cetraspora pellucida]|uniref:17118_t:CDS:1 n=1 Tax=Cetraspora pellucida TaxID=1433469 RepID=A0A9N9C7U8_9GLOM|nr:17118_t:CDS:1 [Cetraspora pellucida]
MDKRLIFLIFFSAILSSLFDLAYPITSACSGKRNCHVSCTALNGLVHDCNVTSCTFTTPGSAENSCVGSCWDALDYNVNQTCDYSCGTGCTFSCPNCEATGPNASDWFCGNCK